MFGEIGKSEVIALILALAKALDHAPYSIEEKLLIQQLIMLLNSCTTIELKGNRDAKV